MFSKDLQEVTFLPTQVNCTLDVTTGRVSVTFRLRSVVGHGGPGGNKEIGVSSVKGETGDRRNDNLYSVCEGGVPETLTTRG